MPDFYDTINEELKPFFPWPPGTKVLVRDFEEQCWSCRLFGCFTTHRNIPYRYVVLCGDLDTNDNRAFQHCIPFSGNEHLEGSSLPEGTPPSPDYNLAHAAPIMLDALKHACNLNRVNLSCGNDCNQCGKCPIGQAIAKAEGRDHG